MKLKKLFALALCFALCMSCLAAFGSASAVEIPGNPVHLTKEITKAEGDNRDFNVHLEAYTDGKKTYVPADIVLVLEESARMSTQMYEYTKVYENNGLTSNEYFVKNGDSYTRVSKCYFHGWSSGFCLWFFHLGRQYDPLDKPGDSEIYKEWYEKSTVQFYTRSPAGTNKQIALIAAAKAFTKGVYDDAVAHNVAHRVSVVSFANSADIDIGLVDDIRNNKDTKNGVNAQIDKLEAAGNSNLNAGLIKAQDAFATAVETPTDNNKIVVVFTYGVPGSATETGTAGSEIPIWDQTAIGLADDAIGTAQSMKATDSGITIYTVGLGDDVDPTLDILDSQVDKNQDIYRTNAFLHFVSSNFPNASNLTTNGGGDNSGIDKGYYLSALDSVSMNAVFGKLTSEFAAAEINLGASTEIRDFMSQYFMLKPNSEITVSAADYNAATKEFGTPSTTDASLRDVTVTAVDGGSSVVVKGFDFNTYFVGGNSPKQLEIDFTITPVEGFLGGNAVPTNDYTKSGIFSYDTEAQSYSLIENFQRCTADVPINYNVTKTQDVTVYRGNQVSVTDLYTIPAVGGIYNDFVTVEYLVNGQTVSVGPEDVLDTKWFNALSSDGCADFPLTGTVKPVNAGPVANASITPETAKVHVLNPILDGTDVTIWQGNSTKLAATTSWACTCSEPFKTPADATEGLAALNATTPVFTEKGKTDAVITASPADCTQYTVAFTANNIPYTNDFWVHVLTASITVDDTKIYLSESVTVDDVKKLDHYSWETSCGHDNVPEMTETEKNAQKTPEPSFATVTPTNCGEHKAYLKIGTITYTTSDTFTIHVLKPTVETLGTTIFLGDDARLTGSVDSWACDRQVCENIQSGSKNADIEDDITWEFVKVDDNKVTTDKVTDEKLTKCTPTVAIGTLYGQKFTSETVMVHVVLPTVTGAEATIKMGNPAPLAATTEWGNDKCEGGHVEAPDEPNFALGSKFYDGATPVTNTSYPNDCHVYTAKAVVDGVEYGFVYHDFMIHVQTPEVTGKTDTIYQGQNYDLTSTVTWKKCAHDKALTNESEQDPAATTTYQIKNSEGSFIDAGKKANYDACSDYKVTYQLTNVPNSFTGEFTVHVLIPTFTVETQDLWADLGTNVTLFRAAADVDAVKSCGSSWIYSGANCGHQNPPAAADLPTGAPDVAVTKVAFNEGEAAAIKEQDVSVTANAVTYTVNGKTYTAGNDRLTGSLTAKLHANTFILKVVNSSAQNGIFTLKQGNTALYDVAVPGNSNTTKIAGLYCTKPYNLDETAGNAWSWRYNTAVKSNEAVHAKPGVVATENCNAVVEVTVNYGDTQDNAKWLADEDCVVNKATTQAATINPTLSVKKKDEEVTNV